MKLLAFGILACAVAVPANATVVFKRFHIEAGPFRDFVDYMNPSHPHTPSPLRNVSILFNIKFDTTGAVTDAISNISLTYSNLILSSPLSFSYDPSTDRLIVGGLFAGAGTVQAGTDDFNLVIYQASTYMPYSPGLGYSQAAIGPAYFDAIGTSVSSTPFPEPATWAMFIVGFGAIGSAMRLRSGSTSVSFAS